MSTCVCGSTSWAEEDHGSQAMKVCVECGRCTEEITYSAEVQESSGAGSQIAYADGPSSQGRFHAPVSSGVKSERKLIKAITDAATTLHLSKQSTAVCVTIGKSLLQKGMDVGKSRKKFALAIVYLELQKTSPTLSFQKIADKFKIKKTILGRFVKKLKKAGVSPEHLNVPLPGVPFEARLDACLDKVASRLSLDERKETKKMAIELNMLCSEVPLNGKLMLDTDSSDVAFYIVARQALLPAKDHRMVFAEAAANAKIIESTLHNRVYHIRAILLQLAKMLPSLSHIENMNVRTIIKFIPTILSNKTFLMTGPDRFLEGKVVDDEKTGGTPVLPLPPAPPWTGIEGEDEGELSDLDEDIAEYIASESEVEQKRLASSELDR